MAIAATGAVSLQDVEDEFAGTGEISLSEYYRSNTFGPVSGNNTSVPGGSAGTTISLGNFRGTEKKRYVVAKGLAGGGAGGFGLDDGGSSGRNTSGSNTTYSIGSSLVFTAVGGLGGLNAQLSADSSDRAGESCNTADGYTENYGTGGSGGSTGSAGGNPSGNGAGGGGGGGDHANSGVNRDSAGNAGQGGRRGQEITDTRYISLNTTLTLVIGGGGTYSSGGDYAGRSGAAGKFTLFIDGTETDHTSLGTTTVTVS